jgi:hypothetical protein
MKLARLLAVVAAVIFAAVLVYMLVGWILSLVWYVFVFAIVGAAGYGVYKLFAQRDGSKQLNAKDDLLLADNKFEKADRLLSEYKKKISTKD